MPVHTESRVRDLLWQMSKPDDLTAVEKEKRAADHVLEEYEWGLDPQHIETDSVCGRVGTGNIQTACAASCFLTPIVFKLVSGVFFFFFLISPPGNNL